MKYEIEKWAELPRDDYASRITRDVSRKVVAVENEVFLKLGGAIADGGFIASVQREHGPTTGNMGRTVFLGEDGKTLATVTVKMREDGSHIDITAEYVFSSDGETNT